MAVGRPPFAQAAGTSVVLIATGVVIPDNQTVTVIDPETGEFITIEQPVIFGPGKAVAVVENEDGDEEYRLCGAFQDTGMPQAFLGFQTNIIDGGGIRPIVTASRGSRVMNPVVTEGVELVAGKDVFLSTVPGEITQDPAFYDMRGSVMLRVGYAVSAVKMILATDYRTEL